MFQGGELVDQVVDEGVAVVEQDDAHLRPPFRSRRRRRRERCWQGWRRCNEEIGIIAEDSYYKDQSHLEMSERVKTNYDHPNSMDRDLLIQHLKALKAGNSVEIPVYSYVDHTRTHDVTYFTPKSKIGRAHV